MRNRPYLVLKCSSRKAKHSGPTNDWDANAVWVDARRAVTVTQTGATGRASDTHRTTQARQHTQLEREEFYNKTLSHDTRHETKKGILQQKFRKEFTTYNIPKTTKGVATIYATGIEFLGLATRRAFELWARTRSWSRPARGSPS